MSPCPRWTLGTIRIQSASSNDCAYQDKSSQNQEQHERETHLASSNPSPGTRTPFCNQEAKCMACTQTDTGQKSPLFTSEPVIVLDVVCVGEEWVERKKWESVEIGVPRECYV
jgi:hypothetical protein